MAILLLLATKFLFAYPNVFSIKLVTVFKCSTCLLLSFWMEYLWETKAVCHPAPDANCDVLLIKFPFPISLPCCLPCSSELWKMDCMSLKIDYVSSCLPVFTLLCLWRHKHLLSWHGLDKCVVSIWKVRVMQNSSSGLLAIASTPHFALCSLASHSWTLALAFTLASL